MLPLGRSTNPNNCHQTVTHDCPLHNILNALRHFRGLTPRRMFGSSQSQVVVHSRCLTDGGWPNCSSLSTLCNGRCSVGGRCDNALVGGSCLVSAASPKVFASMSPPMMQLIQEHILLKGPHGQTTLHVIDNIWIPATVHKTTPSNHTPPSQHGMQATQLPLSRSVACQMIIEENQPRRGC